MLYWWEGSKFVFKNFTHKVAVEALTELKHARSVGQRPRDTESLTTWNINAQIQLDTPQYANNSPKKVTNRWKKLSLFRIFMVMLFRFQFWNLVHPSCWYPVDRLAGGMRVRLETVIAVLLWELHVVITWERRWHFLSGQHIFTLLLTGIGRSTVKRCGTWQLVTRQWFIANVMQ